MVVSWTDRPLAVVVDETADESLRNHYSGDDLHHLLGLWARLIHLAQTDADKAKVGREFLKIEDVAAHCDECEPWASVASYARTGKY